MTEDQAALQADDKKLQIELNKLNPSPIVELYELDMRPCGDDTVLYFHNGTNGIQERVYFKGNYYEALPIVIRGFELSNSGEPARPSLSIMNLGGFVSAAILGTNDLVGAVVTRRRTLYRYLDTKGEARRMQPELPPDVYIIEQKLRENRTFVEFELGSGFDLDGVRFPNRQVVGQYCTHQYRGVGCGFGGRICMTDKYNTLMITEGKYRREWNATAEYRKHECVEALVDGYWRVYECDYTAPVETPNAAIKGEANGPANAPSYWIERQRWRGAWDVDASYLKNDVVLKVAIAITRSIDGEEINIVAKAKRDLPAGAPAPPNSNYWDVDYCTKYVVSCKYRFDGMRTGQVLPFGGFPGTLQMPGDI